MHEVFDLDGTNIARGRCQSSNGSPIEIQLTIVAASGFTSDSGAYYPAESITILDCAGVEALGDLCQRLVAEYRQLRTLYQEKLLPNGPTESLEPGDDDA